MHTPIEIIVLQERRQNSSLSKMSSIFGTVADFLEKVPISMSDRLRQQVQKPQEPNHSIIFTEREEDNGWRSVTTGDIESTMLGCWDDCVVNEDFLEDADELQNNTQCTAFEFSISEVKDAEAGDPFTRRCAWRAPDIPYGLPDPDRLTLLDSPRVSDEADRDGTEDTWIEITEKCTPFEYSISEVKAATIIWEDKQLSPGEAALYHWEDLKDWVSVNYDSEELLSDGDYQPNEPTFL